ncbi:hypothetical protein PCE1_003150 [Barthelona sp. PCE]
MRILVISTRLNGTDGVSLESLKLVSVLEKVQNHEFFYMAGELDPALEQTGKIVPSMHFDTKFARKFTKWYFNRLDAPCDENELLKQHEAVIEEIKREVITFIEENSIEYLILQNIFAIPMQVSLAIAIKQVLEETGLPGLAHNHDFFWERKRFDNPRDFNLIEAHFPPVLDNLKHIVINTKAQTDLKNRRSVDSIVVPNVFDFAKPPRADDYHCDLRTRIGLSEDEIFVAQPTRVVERKGIESSVDLLAGLNARGRKTALVITHSSGDEGNEYLDKIMRYADEKGVRIVLCDGIVSDERGINEKGEKIYSLHDTYHACDFVSYPSVYEGFGNALIETVYFSRPIMVNDYHVYVDDIKPCGFKFVNIEGGKITEATLDAVEKYLDDDEYTSITCAYNYQVGYKYFSHERLLELLLAADDRL